MYIPVGANAYSDNDRGLPQIVLENWYGAEAPDRPNRPYRLLPTPGLTSFTTGISGPVRGMAQIDGLNNGALIVASGIKAYSVSENGTATQIGRIEGEDRAQFAASQADLVMTAGGTAYTVTTSLSAISIPAASGAIVGVSEVGQRHLYLEDGTGRIHYSVTGDPNTISGFITAEAEPDNVLAVEHYGGTILLLGTQSSEGWYDTGSTDLPFLRRPGFVINRGIIGRHAVARGDFGLFVAGDDGAVYRLDGFQPVRISTETIEREIEKVAAEERGNISISSHQWGGHLMVGLHLPGVGDYFFSALTRSWHRRRETNDSRYLVDSFVHAYGKVFAGDANAGAIYRLDKNVFSHNGAEVRRVATGILPVEDGKPSVFNLTAELQPGVGLETGQGSDPQCFLRVARDGHTFGNEVSRSFGGAGEFGKHPRFGPLGQLKPPAAVIEIAVSDPVGATLTGLKLNRSVA